MASKAVHFSAAPETGSRHGPTGLAIGRAPAPSTLRGESLLALFYGKIADVPGLLTSGAVGGS